MTNKLPEHNEETTKVVAIPPFEMELDFTQGDPESLLDHIWSTVRDYVVPLIKDKRLHDPRVIAILVNEIAKNVRHHGWGKWYIHIESEYDPIIQKDILHFVVGDFGEWLKKDDFDYDQFIKDGHPVSKPWTYGIGGGMILAYATALQMDLVVYDNDNRRVMYGRHKGYNRQPKNRRWGKGVHYVGTTILQELPQNPQLHIKLDFPAGLTERKYARDELRNTTLARIEKELGRSLETDGEKITYLMTDFLGELWKNVQDHAGGQGNYYLEKEYDPLLAQHIVHFIVWDKGLWIKGIATSLDNFFKEDFSTWSTDQLNTGRGGYAIREAAQKLNMHLVLYDNDEKHVVNNVLNEYDRLPKAHICDPTQGANFIGSLILPIYPYDEVNKPLNAISAFDIELDFDIDPMEHLQLDQRLILEVEEFLKEYFDNSEEHFWDVSVIVEAICENINDHGGKKGYLHLEVERDPVLGQHIAHFVVGDFGPGISSQHGELHALLGSESRLKRLSEHCNMHLVLRNNDETHIVNCPHDYVGYSREPKEKRRGKGAHFAGTVILPPAKEQQRGEIIFQQSFEFWDDTQALMNLEVKLFEKLLNTLEEQWVTEEQIHYFPKILNEGLKNIYSYGGWKGYIVIEQDGDFLRFAFGDYGPGIRKHMLDHPSHGKKEGDISGSWHGTRMIKENAEECGIYLVLYDWGQKQLIHGGAQRCYSWRPPYYDMSTWAHFVWSFKLLKK